MNNLYTELAEYVKREKTLVEARCLNSSVELAWAFEEQKANPIKYYRESDLYIFNLTRYQARLQNSNYHQWFQKVAQDKEFKKGLDYGGGIGETTICAITAGVEEMTFVEIAKSKTLDYATWRFKKHKVLDKIKIVNEGFKIKEDYDFIIAMDVFEHLENPQPVIEQIAKHTKYIFCNPNQIKYNYLYPQHISRFTLEPYFEELRYYLYKRKEGENNEKY